MGENPREKGCVLDSAEKRGKLTGRGMYFDGFLEQRVEGFGSGSGKGVFDA